MIESMVESKAESVTGTDSSFGMHQPLQHQTTGLKTDSGQIKSKATTAIAAAGYVAALIGVGWFVAGWMGLLRCSLLDLEKIKALDEIEPRSLDQ